MSDTDSSTVPDHELAELAALAGKLAAGKATMGEQKKVRTIIKRYFLADIDGYLSHLPGDVLGSFIGCTSSTVSNWYQQGCPRNADRTYSISDVIKWIRAQSAPGNNKSRAKKEQDMTDDPDRMKKEYAARLEAIKYETKVGTVLDRNQITTAFFSATSTIRQAGEVLQKTYGDDARAILDEHIQEAERQIQHALAEYQAKLTDELLEEKRTATYRPKKRGRKKTNPEDIPATGSLWDDPDNDDTDPEEDE